MNTAFDFNSKRCSACGACSVACMDKHSMNLKQGDSPFRKVERIEDMEGLRPTEYVMKGCMHCEDAPCVAACPAGCLQTESSGLVVYDAELCIGCGICAEVCEYGAISYDRDGKISKCDGCADLVKEGKKPACAAICPLKALTFKK